jgi:glycosyltransferase involved in cell wall biosynthesis
MSAFPSLSNTFIRREVEAVRETGIEVQTFAIRRSPDHQVLSVADEQARRDTVTLQPLRARSAWRALVRPALRHPGPFVRTLVQSLRTGGTDGRELVWRLFYFVEAMVLWDECRRRGLRHLHAHHAQVSTTLVWLATSFANRANSAGDDGRWTWSFTMHGSFEFVAERQHSLALKAESADFVVCVSNYTRAQMMRLSPPERWDKFRVVHCGIDPERFTKVTHDQAPHPFTILHVGRLSPEKGQTLLVEALAMVRHAGIDARLLLVGEGRQRPAIEAAIKELDLTDHVEMPGAVGQDDILDWYRRADAFVLCSFMEGLPVVLMEAMACDLPVVASNINGIPELVQDGVTGRTVTAGSAVPIAEALIDLATDPVTAHRLAEAGRAVVVGDFDLADNAHRLAAIFRSFLDDGGLPDDDTAPAPAAATLIGHVD